MPKQRLTDLAIKKLKPPASGRVEHWDAVMPGLVLRVTSNGAKSFGVRGRVNGQLFRVTLGKAAAMSIVTARDRARTILALADEGIDPREHAKEKKREAERERRSNFRRVAEEYMEHHVRAKGLRTADEVRRMIDRELLPAWGDMPISSITKGDIRELLREKKKSAPVRVNRLQALIQTLFKWAAEEDLIDASPAVGLRKLGKETQRERFHTDDEIKRIWLAADSVGYPYGTLLQWLLVTGQRRGEAAEMRWSQIDGDVWNVPGGITKSGRGHAVPLSSLALAILEDVPHFKHIEDGVGKDVDHVFVSGRTGDSALSGWSKLKVNIDDVVATKRNADGTIADDRDPLPPWRVHDLRRTVATGMRSLGVDRLTVSKTLNHAEAGVTAIYDRFAADPEKRHALEAWSAHLVRVVFGEPGDNVVPMMQRQT